MKPETLKTPVGELEGKRSLTDLLDGVEGMPRRQKAAVLPKVIKEIVAGRISSAEANEIARAMKVR